MKTHIRASHKALLCWMVILLLQQVRAEDWPTYRHDNRRSGVTSEQLPAPPLKEAWVYESDVPPQPAWPGPAKWDAYAGIVGLRAMRNYDPAFFAVAVGDSVYFGSSADDSVHCLNAATGEEQWSYTVDGAVRIAPTWSDGKLYFGADDGFAYCLKASNQKLVWKFRPSPERDFIPSNGKLISMWPCRTGVLVDDGKAYFGMALVPWENAYLCAVHAKKGKAEGDGLFCRTLKKVTIEGALLASPTRLYVPQGRSAPMVVNRKNGALLGAVEGGGGTFAVLTPDNQFAHGPGNKTGWITVSNAETRDKIASFEGGNVMVVASDRAYVLKDTELTAVDRTSGNPVWTIPLDCPYELILAGDTLFAGGNGKVKAIAATDGKAAWSGAVSGRAYGLAAANGRLLVSTDTGAIHCFE